MKWKSLTSFTSNLLAIIFPQSQQSQTSSSSSSTSLPVAVKTTTIKKKKNVQKKETCLDDEFDHHHNPNHHHYHDDPRHQSISIIATSKLDPTEVVWPVKPFHNARQKWNRQNLHRYHRYNNNNNNNNENVKNTENWPRHTTNSSSNSSKQKVLCFPLLMIISFILLLVIINNVDGISLSSSTPYELYEHDDHDHDHKSQEQQQQQPKQSSHRFISSSSSSSSPSFTITPSSSSTHNHHRIIPPESSIARLLSKRHITGTNGPKSIRDWNDIFQQRTDTDWRMAWHDEKHRRCQHQLIAHMELVCEKDIYKLVRKRKRRRKRNTDNVDDGDNDDDDGIWNVDQSKSKEFDTNDTNDDVEDWEEKEFHANKNNPNEDEESLLYELEDYDNGGDSTSLNQTKKRSKEIMATTGKRSSSHRKDSSNTHYSSQTIAEPKIARFVPSKADAYLFADYRHANLLGARQLFRVRRKNFQQNSDQESAGGAKQKFVLWNMRKRNIAQSLIERAKRGISDECCNGPDGCSWEEYAEYCPANVRIRTTN